MYQRQGAGETYVSHQTVSPLQNTCGLKPWTLIQSLPSAKPASPALPSLNYQAPGLFFFFTLEEAGGATKYGVLHARTEEPCCCRSATLFGHCRLVAVQSLHLRNFISTRNQKY
jgi:hypothetical protein